jgi:DNA polymerase III alpha subunit
VRIFGPGRTWVEIQRPGLRGDRALARGLEQLAAHVGLPVVATGDVHAHSPGRAFLQDALVAIRHGLTLDASEEARRGNRQSVLRSPAEMAGRLHEHPEAVAETLRLAERIQFDLTRDQFPPEQAFRECAVPEAIVRSVSGPQAEELLRRVAARIARDQP